MTTTLSPGLAEQTEIMAYTDFAQARGRGAQSTLLAARVRAAAAEGCRWLVAEAGAEGPGEHNPSLHNMVRAGFEPLYERVTWLWRA